MTALPLLQATGLGGTTGAGHSADQIESMEPVRERVIRVTFNADVHSSIQWNFKPQQSEIYVSGFACTLAQTRTAPVKASGSACYRAVTLQSPRILIGPVPAYLGPGLEKQTTGSM